jgi:hypothetical protein
MFTWFYGKHDFLQYVIRLKPYQLEAEKYLSSKREVDGYWAACQPVSIRH